MMCFLMKRNQKPYLKILKKEKKLSFIIGIDRNTKPRETKGMSIKLKTVSGEVDMKDAIVSQESFAASRP